MHSGVLEEYQQIKNRAPAWVEKLPRFVRTVLVKAFYLRNDWRDFNAEMIAKLPSHALRCGLYRLVGVRLGDRTSIHRGCRFYAPGNVLIGDHTVINRDVLLDGRCGLLIGNNVSISEGVMILTLEHDLNSPEFAACGARVVIGDYVFIGARALILPGIVLNRGAVVAAGAVVTHDVPECQIVAGVPARPIGMRSSTLQYRLDYQKFLG
jgi:acetyltransferase-like isoleucine patch superfamily enzyme